MGVNRKNDLTEGSIGKKLFFLTVPMVGGMFSMVAFNLTDTYFVSRLGTIPLAAMGFTFPVVMVVHAISLGLGMGASSVISRAIGEGDTGRVRRLTTDALLLAILVVGLVSLIGYLTMNPVFRLLGASDDILPLIRQYMTIWYAGMIVIMFPMVVNHAIRAAGDTRDPSLIMMASAGLNVVLDPLFIFGIGWFPALGLVGAAVATVTSRVITLIGAILILHYRHRMLSWVRPRLRDIAQSWRQLLYIAIPTSATNVLFPLSLGVFTRLVAGYGKEAVAGVGAAGRVESFAMMVLWALASTLIPFVGQNWGARNLERVRRVQRFSYAFSLGWGLFCWIMFLFFARPIAGLFSAEPGVIKTIVLYLSIIPFGFGMRGVSMYTSISFNAINKPLCAAAINIIRLVVFYIPMAWLGGHFFGLLGIFGGIALSYICAGFAALWWERKVCPLDRHFNEMAAADEIEAELSAP